MAKNDQSLPFWAGATEPSWTALGEGAEAQTTFFEMLSQANQGTVAVLSADFPSPLRCEDGLMEAPLLPLQVEGAQIKLQFRGVEAGIILLLVDQAALAISTQADPRPPFRPELAMAPRHPPPARLYFHGCSIFNFPYPY